jgi:hypothetical protein
MTRARFTFWQIALTWIAFGIFAASNAHAEPLVLDFAAIDSTTTIWRLPKDAQFVKVLRGAVESVVPVSDLVPTDRVRSCDDPNVLPGSTTKCGTVQPDTKNNWRLWAVLSPAPPPPNEPFTEVKVTWNHPSDMTDIVGYRVQLKLQGCNPTQPSCPVEGYGTPIDLGIVDAYSTSVPGTFFEICASVLPRAEDRFGTYVEGCNKAEVGRVLNLKVEFTTR